MATTQQNEKTSVSPSNPQHGDVEVATNTTPAAPDKDVASNLVGDRAQEIDPETEARVLRKIDWFLIPAMIVGTSIHSSNSHQPSPTTMMKLSANTVLTAKIQATA
jgi:hypothetical protein